MAQTKTVTVYARQAEPTCPVCYDCKTQGCGNFGSCDNGICSCPSGFGGKDCNTPACGSTNLAPSLRPLRNPGQTCTCDPGFVGFNCNICTSDSVCKTPSDAPIGSSSVCNRSPTVWKAGSVSCGVEAPLLTAVYPKISNITLARNITDKSMLGSLWYDNEQQFMCKMTDCSQSVINNQYTFRCNSVQCVCIPGSAFCGGVGVSVNFQQSIVSADGDFAFTCPATGGGVNGAANLTSVSIGTSTCTASFSFLASLFPKGLPLPHCVFGECALPSDNPGDISAKAPSALQPGELAVIAISGGIVAICLLGLLWAAAYQHYAKNLAPPPVKRGATITFDKISYTIPSGRTVISDVSGSAPAGKVLAIMGPSGAGKSTFLDIIAGKSKSGKVGGTVLIDGQKVSKTLLRSLVAYVDQDDLMLPTLTVRETIMFSANLRLPECISLYEKKARVEEVLHMLGLAHVGNTVVGGNGKRGISGGERRRVSIGVELVTSPSVLFLDEPTSGLDSYNALSVVKTLANLAHQHGKTVIFTIHQPRSDVYTLFDEILVMKRGAPLYCGPNTEVESFMKDMGQPCPSGYNMADHLLDIASDRHLNNGEEGDPTKTDVEITTGSEHDLALDPNEKDTTGSQGGGGALAVKSLIKKLSSFKVLKSEDGGKDENVNNIYSSTNVSEESIDNNNNTSPSSTTPIVNQDKPETTEKVSSASPKKKDSNLVGVKGCDNNKPALAVGFLTQTTVLMKRAQKNLIRTPSLLLAHVILSLILGAFIGGVYYRSDNTLGGVQNRFGSLLMIMALLGFSGLSAIGSFVHERQLFLRERSNGFYGPLPFFITKVVYDIIPLRILPALMMGSISFFMIGFTGGPDRFLKYIIVLMMFAAQIGLLCLSLAIGVSDVGTATLVAAIVILFKMMFAGFLINQANMPPALGWIQYLSLFRFAYEALVVNDLTDVQVIDTVSGATVNIPASIVLTKFGFVLDTFWRNFSISSGITVGLLIIVALLITFALKEKR
ncbi:hypothetical protein HDV05_006981 [Chytridiales sp. JEL 0842]|nr:hypothetical protein HDV05_006981 [Chytridiales sp. JEL 0842]